jgi:hypothetical protein
MKNELMKTGGENLPAFVEKGDQRGTEHITKEDIKMPRVALGQGLSPQRIKNDPKFIKGLELGDMFNDLTEEIYGTGPIEFTVVRADKPRGIEFYPIDDGGGVKDLDVPLDDERMMFTRDEEGRPVKPIATKFYDFIILMLKTRELAVLSLKGTGLKAAKELNGLMMIKQGPSFLGKYSVTSSVETNSKGTFGVYRIKNMGNVEEEDYKLAESIFENVKDKRLDIERESEETEDTTPF